MFVTVQPNENMIVLIILNYTSDWSFLLTPHATALLMEGAAMQT